MGVQILPGHTRIIPQDLAISGDITPAAISSTQNDYNPTGLSSATVLRISTSSAITRLIGGIAGGTDGRILILQNIGSGMIRLVDDDASSSSAENRMILPSNQDVFIMTDAAAVLWYDATSLRWRLMAGIPGEQQIVDQWRFLNGIAAIDGSTGFVMLIQSNLGSVTADTNVYLPGGDGTDVLLIDEISTQSLSNKSLGTAIIDVNCVAQVDTSSSGFRFYDLTTNTKALRLVLSGLAASTNNTFTLTGTTVRDWKWEDVPGSMVVVGNDADPPATDAIGKVSRTAQAAAIAATNLTNSTPAGFYQVNFYASTTTANALDGTIAFQINYTDRVGATNQVTAGTLTLAALSTGATALKGTFVLYLASGNITYQTNLTGAQTTSRYALEVRGTFLG